MSTTLNKVGVGGHELELWRRLKRERDQRARGELIEIYMPMARRMAGRYAGVVESHDDLVQVASLGLLNAIDRFDIDRGTPFVGFAKPTIRGRTEVPLPRQGLGDSRSACPGDARRGGEPSAAWP